MKTEQMELNHCKRCDQMTNWVCAKCKKDGLFDAVNNLYRLDWVAILNRAIENRRTSWGERPVNEWRNASDELAGEVINAIRKGWNLPHPIEKAKEELKKQIEGEGK